MIEGLEEETLESKEEVQNWINNALNGDIDEGVYKLDVSQVEKDMAYKEDRAMPGFTAPHSRSDLQCVARVSNDSIKENKAELEQVLDSLYSGKEFLGTEGYGVTSRRNGTTTVSRGCYFQE